MITLVSTGQTFSVNPNETVLEAALRQGVALSFSCRGGVCHHCLLRCTSGVIPARAQKGLTAEQVANGYLLPCVCRPEGDMHITTEAAHGNTPSPPVDDPAPNLPLWDALQQGVLLQRALDDFYHRVYADPLLSPFFEGIPRQRLLEKQYSFLRQVITGEQRYLGNRPYHAHHWMVISPELFLHRERMMLDCLRVQGLAEEWVQQLQQLEARYKPEIVKDRPIPRKVGDVEVPLEGFESLVMDVDYFCDPCGGEVRKGETVYYHLRLGKMYCQRCHQPNRINLF